MRLRLQHDGQVDYQVARHNSDWADHVARTNVTAGLIAWLTPKTLIDPACGDGSIALAAHRLHPVSIASLSDISTPNIAGLDLPLGWNGEVADIERALGHPILGSYDLVVLTEILEHVERPEDILRLARRRASVLIASSPEMRSGQLDVNPEHLWQFDGEDYNQLLVETGWVPFHKTHMAFPQHVYDFGIWVAR